MPYCYGTIPYLFLVGRICTHRSALIWLSWIRILADLDPRARKLIKIHK
jgi:hypothetical protein